MSTHWNYRMCCAHLDSVTEVWSIREVYYDNGKVTGYTAEPADPFGENCWGLLRDIQMMLEATMRPALDLSTLRDIPAISTTPPNPKDRS